VKVLRVVFYSAYRTTAHLLKSVKCHCAPERCDFRNLLLYHVIRVCLGYELLVRTTVYGEHLTSSGY